MKLPRKKAVHKARAPRSQNALWTHRAEKLLTQVVTRAQRVAVLKKRAPSRSWTIEIEVVGAAKMRRLNLESRGKDQSTDVLSFELPAGFRKQGLIGSIVICLPVLKAQAKAEKHSLDAELEVLTVHGVLHLLGFDHERGPQAAREMARLEQRILKGSKGSVIGQSSGRLIGLIQR